MNGRKMKPDEKLLRENILDEKYCLHHICYELINCFPTNHLKRIKKDSSVIAVPRELHVLLRRSSPYTPNDVSTFHHQFMMMQIIAQLYDGFEDILNAMISYDDFDSFANYRFWMKEKTQKCYSIDEMRDCFQRGCFLRELRHGTHVEKLVEGFFIHRKNEVPEGWI